MGSPRQLRSVRWTGDPPKTRTSFARPHADCVPTPRTGGRQLRQPGFSTIGDTVVVLAVCRPTWSCAQLQMRTPWRTRLPEPRPQRLRAESPDGVGHVLARACSALRSRSARGDPAALARLSWSSDIDTSRADVRSSGSPGCMGGATSASPAWRNATMPRWRWALTVPGPNHGF